MGSTIEVTKLIAQLVLIVDFMCMCVCVRVGRQYDKKGNSIEWFDEESLEQFERKAQCIEDQYSAFTFWGRHVSYFIITIDQLGKK